MTEPTPLPDQLFVLDRGEDAGEFLDMLLTLCTFGIRASLLLVGSGVTALATEHRGIPLARFPDMGLKQLMVDASAVEDQESEPPESAITVNRGQIQDLYARVPRILHP
ncbi:hypothetical protein [Vreelandella utahensis]|nr:hypothetical protein [Halomonas utahensis]